MWWKRSWFFFSFFQVVGSNFLNTTEDILYFLLQVLVKIAAQRSLLPGLVLLGSAS